MPAAPLDEAIRQLREGDLAHVEAARQQVLDFCAAHPDVLHRSSTSGHLTGSSLVVDPTTGRFVVLHHRKLDRWLQPGGHADGDGDLAAVALHEAEEETGLPGLEVRRRAVDLDVHEVRPPGEAPHLHLDLRFVVTALPGASDGGAPPGNHESHAVRWAVAADLDELGADDSLRRLVSRGLAATRPQGWRSSPSR